MSDDTSPAGAEPEDAGGEGEQNDFYEVLTELAYNSCEATTDVLLQYVDTIKTQAVSGVGFSAEAKAAALAALDAVRNAAEGLRGELPVLVERVVNEFLEARFVGEETGEQPGETPAG